MNHLSFLLTSIFIMTGLSGFSQKSAFTNDNKIALKGYDVVAYHLDYNAVRGNNEHTSTMNDITYYFSNAENHQAFQKNPDKYLPAYGGFCAFAMGMQGKTVPSDPNTFKIRDGKLYLFFNDYYEGKPFNTIIPWNSNEKDMVEKANANWSTMKK